MKWFCIVLAVCVLYVAHAHADILSLDTVDGLVDTAVKQLDQAAAPVNQVLKKAGLSKCAKTVKVTKYIGKCIPAKLKCIGVDVLDKATNSLVKIPACADKKKKKKGKKQQQQQQQQGGGQQQQQQQ